MSKSGLTYQQKENKLHAEISRWFVIYTKYKTEKYVVDKLTKKSIEAYLPLIKYSKRYTSKIKHYEVPLINCYVFVKITKEDYVKVLETEYVSGFLKNRGNLNNVREEEINILKRIVGEKYEIETQEMTFAAGRKVEIISGNLTGIAGTVVEKEGKSEFIIELESIGYQFKMKINKSLLRNL